ncbi:hypothetical protein BJ875DRAFT_503817 [Amylocarpus encephaloides]|uniref:Uncharacterized protein n=1 Tax=Amylocarpus encephaloides TaxID=45428 RepID=A0A9P7YLD7_9HELO|nr:hypothetical protein BJ875DRAFT_503817 [Amylocarpus encephaloides]
MTKSANKLTNKKAIVVGGTSGTLLDADAIVTAISSNQSRVDEAMKKLNFNNVARIVGNVQEKVAFVGVLKNLAPVEHIVFSGVDKIIHCALEGLDIGGANHLCVYPSDSLIPKEESTTALKPGNRASIGRGLGAGVVTLAQGLPSDLAKDRKRIFEETMLPVGFVAMPNDITEAYLNLAKADYATGSSVESGEYTES